MKEIKRILQQMGAQNVKTTNLNGGSIVFMHQGKEVKLSVCKESKSLIGDVRYTAEV